VDPNELFPACHCEERSDEAIQLDCHGRQASLAMTNEGVHQQRSEESSRSFDRGGVRESKWILRCAQNDSGLFAAPTKIRLRRAARILI
jgi:hypothetical protein